METRRAGAASVDGVAGAAVNAGACLIAAIAVKARQARWEKQSGNELHQRQQPAAP